MSDYSVADEAISIARTHRLAFLKFIAPNDTKRTGSHQSGIYLAKGGWRAFSPEEPAKGINKTYEVRVEWHDGRITDSTIKWYGKSKNEYRLTGFNREKNFPHFSDEKVGSLFVLVPTGDSQFRAFVLDDDNDALEVQAALGVEMSAGKPAFYDPDLGESDEDITARCLTDQFQAYTDTLLQFPSTAEVSLQALRAIRRCLPKFEKKSLDDRLSIAIQEEYRLFRQIERKISADDIARASHDIDEFIGVAQTILQRRKSRAGRSLEFHVEQLLREASIPFEAQPRLDNTRPDIVIPSVRAYEAASAPTDELYVIGIKTTCKDRWRQVLSEAPKIPRKHILTLQPGISPKQMDEMNRSNVQLIVPKPLHGKYLNPDALTTVEAFVQEVHYKFVSNTRQ